MTRKIKRIEITGTAQMWDLYDQRFDIAEVTFDVPEGAWSELTEEEIKSIEDECAVHCDDGTVTTKLFKRALDEGWVEVHFPGWEWEDPYDLVGYVDYEEE